MHPPAVKTALAAIREAEDDLAQRQYRAERAWNLLRRDDISDEQADAFIRALAASPDAQHNWYAAQVQRQNARCQAEAEAMARLRRERVQLALWWSLRGAGVVGSVLAVVWLAGRAVW